MKINIVNHHHVRHEPNEYIGRGSVLGNPFSHREGTRATTKVGTREEAINAYRVWLMEQINESNPKVLKELNRLANILMKDGVLNLRCYCAPKPCHGDVIADIILTAVKDHLGK